MAYAALCLAACGGGGSSTGTGGGGVIPASLTVSPTTLEVNASGNTSWTPTGIINITVHNGPASGVYVGANFTTNVITDASLTDSGGIGSLTLSFKDPSQLSVGTYTDTVIIAICTDATCNTRQSGSEKTVTVKYTVSLDATVALSADLTQTGVGMPVVLTWSSTHAQSCTASGEWSGTLPSAGSQTVTLASLGLHTFGIGCGDPGSVAQTSISVTAVAPALSFTAFPATVTLGKPVSLRWQGQYATSCTASGDWTGALPASGLQTILPSVVGTSHYHLVCSSAGATDQKDATVTVTAAPALPPATAYRMNEAHNGVLITANNEQFPPQSAPTWSRDLGAPVSYPLIANGRIYVATANPDGSYGVQLYALDAATGATVWGPIAIAGTYFGSGLTYDDGRIFTLTFDGIVHAFNAADGAALWTAQLPGYWYEATPNAYGGMVFTAGNYGLSAVEQSSGKILWTNGEGATTDWSSPAVSSEGVFMQAGACGGGGFDAVLGITFWRKYTPCSTTWGYASVVANGVLFGRGGNTLDLFATADGTFINQVASARAPAITATALVALNGGILSATRLSDLVQSWTFTGDGQLVTAPVVVNHTVFIGSSSGNVYGVDLGTGSQVWNGMAPSAINPDSENGGPQPPSGPAAGENVLVFLAGNSLVVWRLQ